MDLTFNELSVGESTQLSNLQQSWLSSISSLPKKQKDEVRKLCLAIIDQSVTGINRSTAYNKKTEQQTVINQTHEALLNFHRGLYAMMYSLPSTEYNKQLAVMYFITSVQDGTFSPEQEQAIVNFWIHNMPVTYVLRAFVELSKKKINKSRLKKLMLRYILNGNITLWAMKYRKKLAYILTHAWNGQQTWLIKRALLKHTRTGAERHVLIKNVFNHLTDFNKKDQVEEALAFVFKTKVPFNYVWKNSAFDAYYKARTDMSYFRYLPVEIAEGIRSMYHPHVQKEQVIQLSGHNQSEKQKAKLSTQKRAQGSTIQRSRSFKSYNATELYIMALKEGMQEEFYPLLRNKARDTYAKSGIGRCETRGIIIDTSMSMRGKDDALNHPVATALATRDVLMNGATTVFQQTTGTKRIVSPRVGDLVSLGGETSLAEALINMLEKECDEIYIITDGYENAPAGRVHEIMSVVRNKNLSGAKVIQLSVTLSAKTAGVRDLSEHIIQIPIKHMNTIKTSMLKAAFQTSLEEGVRTVLYHNKNLLLNA